MFEQLIQQILLELQRRSQMQQVGGLPVQQNNPVPMLAPVSGFIDPSLFGLNDIPPRQINTGVNTNPNMIPQRQPYFTPYVDAPIINVPQTQNPTYTATPRIDNTVPYSPTQTPSRDTYQSPYRPATTQDENGATRDEVLRRMTRHNSGGIFPLLGF